VKSFNTTWTGEACDYLAGEAKRRGEQEKLLVSKDNEREPKEFCDAHGLKTEEVLWLVMKFEESDKEKGRIEFTLNANSALLYLQGASFDPGVSFAKAKPTLDKMLGWFFNFAEGK
jgi:hypothetical protein